MKKLFLMAVMCICVISASAQVEKGFRNGIRVNVGMSKSDAFGSYISRDATIGYGIGWIAEYNFNPHLFLQSGIGFEDVTTKINDYSDYIKAQTLHALYVQIPVHIGYRFELGNTSSLFVQAGPYVGYGIVGSELKEHGYYSRSEKYFDYNARWDFGFGGRVGVEFNKFQISAGGYYGIIENHNQSIDLGLAYFF